MKENFNLLCDEGNPKVAAIEVGKFGNIAAMAAILELSSWSETLPMSELLLFSSFCLILSEALSTELCNICKCEVLLA